MLFMSSFTGGMLEVHGFARGSGEARLEGQGSVACVVRGSKKNFCVC